MAENPIQIPAPISKSPFPSKVSPNDSFAATRPPAIDETFPLLSRSPGFADAMMKQDVDPSTPSISTLPPSLIMSRNLDVLEGSDLYQKADAKLKLQLQGKFFQKFVLPVAKANKVDIKFEDWLRDRGHVWQQKTNQAGYNKAHDPTLAKPLRAAADVLMTGIDLQGEHAKAQTKILEQVPEGALHKVIGAVKVLEDAKVEAINDFRSLTESASLGDALIKAQMRKGPYAIYDVQKILFDNAHIEAARSGRLQKLYETSDRMMANNYVRDTVNNIYTEKPLKPEERVGRELGGLIGEAPLFYGASGLAGSLAIDEILGTTAAKGLPKLAATSVKIGAEGFLVGAAEEKDPAKTAAEWAAVGFGIGGLGLVGKKVLIDPAASFLGRVFDWGGGRNVEALTNVATSAVERKAPEATVSKLSVSLAGSQKQKVTAATINALNELTGGNFSLAPKAAQKAALAQLAKKGPEFAEQAGFIDKSITAAQAMKDIADQRAVSPQYGALLDKFGTITKKPAHIVVADDVEAQIKANMMRRSSDKWVNEVFKTESTQRLIDKDLASKGIQLKRSTDIIVPGAASAKSLEFGDNMSKHIDGQLEKAGLGKLQFEDRRHKWLFYLNVLMERNQRASQLPPNIKHGMQKQMNQEFDILTRKLHEYFPGDEGRLPNLIAMSDKLWAKVENLSKTGAFEGGGKVRIWRQTNLGPGESPFAHEIELLQKAQKADAISEQSKKIVAQGEIVGKESKGARRQGESPEDWVKRTGHLFPDASPKKYAVFGNKTFKEFLLDRPLNEAIQDLKAKGFVPDKAKLDRYTKGETVSLTFTHPDGHSLTVGVNKDGTINGGNFSVGKDVAQIEAERKPPSAEEQDKMLKEAFKKSADKGTGKKDTGKLAQAVEKLFPGRKFTDLTAQERIEAVNESLGKGKKKE